VAAFPHVQVEIVPVRAKCHFVTDLPVKAEALLAEDLENEEHSSPERPDESGNR
jgi:hypothetical protein